MTEMRPNGDITCSNQYSFPEVKKEKKRTDRKFKENYKSSSLYFKAKLNPPIIQPTVIQALPSVQQTLPSLQSIKKRCPPNSPIKQRTAAAPKHTSSGRRILPSLPKIEEFTLPKIQQRAIQRDGFSTKSLPSFQALEGQNVASAQISEMRTCTRMKRVRRVLPSIPPTERRTPTANTREPPSVQPTVVKPLARYKGARRKPSLPTIEEQTSPKHATSTTLQGGDKENTSSTLQLGQTSGKLSRKEESNCFQPGKKEPRKKPKKTAIGSKAIIQSFGKEAQPGLRPIDSSREHLHSSDITADQEQIKERRVSFTVRKKASICPETKEREALSKPAKWQEETRSSDTVELPTAKTSKDRADHPRKDELLSSLKSRKSGHSIAKEVSSNYACLNRDIPLQLTMSTEKRAKICPKILKEEATLKLIKTIRESSEKKEVPCLRRRDGFPNSQHRLDQNLPWPPITRRLNNPEKQWLEKGVLQTRKHREKEDLLRLLSTDINPSRTNPSWVDRYELRNHKQKEPTSTLRNRLYRENEDKPNSRSKMNRTFTSLLSADSNALLNPKRKDLELLPPLQLIAGRKRTGRQSSANNRNNNVLTVKPAFPGTQDTQGSKVPNPPTVPSIKKGLPSARPDIKRAQTRIQTALRRPLPSIQPIIKQVLPSLVSSSLQELVKKPLPSVQPKETHSTPVAATLTEAKSGLAINRELRKSSAN